MACAAIGLADSCGRIRSKYARTPSRLRGTSSGEQVCSSAATAHASQYSFSSSRGEPAGPVLLVRVEDRVPAGELDPQLRVRGRWRRRCVAAERLDADRLGVDLDQDVGGLARRRASRANATIAKYRRVRS